MRPARDRNWWLQFGVLEDAERAAGVILPREDWLVELTDVLLETSMEAYPGATPERMVELIKFVLSLLTLNTGRDPVDVALPLLHLFHELAKSPSPVQEERLRDRLPFGVRR